MVSIIIPYYNRPEKLKRCLRSIHEQTYTDYEIIVIDDCSPKPPFFEIETVIYKKNNRNIGAGASRNVGLQMAKGDYISFLDCDDYWHRDFLFAIMKKFKKEPNATMVYANGVEIDENENEIRSRRNKIIHIETILPYILLNGRPWGTAGCIWKKGCIGDVKWITSHSWEDYAFDVAIGVKHNGISSVEGNLVYYDVSGKDKLSNQNQHQAIIGKNLALLNISTNLASSNFHKDFKTNAAITIHLLNNFIALIELGIDYPDRLNGLLLHIKKRRGTIVGAYVYILKMFPFPLKLRLLRRLRNEIQREIK